MAGECNSLGLARNQIRSQLGDSGQVGWLADSDEWHWPRSLIVETATALPAKPLTADDLSGDLIQLGHPLYGVLWVNRDRMSGAPCFAGTRVPAQSLFDHLEAGDSIDTFLEDFPPVTRAQAVALLELSRSRLLDDLVSR